MVLVVVVYLRVGFFFSACRSVSFCVRKDQREEGKEKGSSSPPRRVKGKGEIPDAVRAVESILFSPFRGGGGAGVVGLGEKSRPPGQGPVRTYIPGRGGGGGGSTTGEFPQFFLLSPLFYFPPHETEKVKKKKKRRKVDCFGKRVFHPREKEGERPAGNPLPSTFKYLWDRCGHRTS